MKRVYILIIILAWVLPHTIDGGKGQNVVINAATLNQGAVPTDTLYMPLLDRQKIIDSFQHHWNAITGIGPSVAGNTLTVTVQISANNIVCYAKKGYYIKLVTTSTGNTATFTYLGGQETLF